MSSETVTTKKCTKRGPTTKSTVKPKLKVKAKVKVKAKAVATEEVNITDSDSDKDKEVIEPTAHVGGGDEEDYENGEDDEVHEKGLDLEEEVGMT